VMGFASNTTMNEATNTRSRYGECLGLFLAELVIPNSITIFSAFLVAR
jgi:hypothetical protein